jgi:hypothetical protein
MRLTTTIPETETEATEMGTERKAVEESSTRTRSERREEKGKLGARQLGLDVWWIWILDIL